MKINEIMRDVEDYVRARYPLVYLQTSEEARGIELLRNLARKMNSDIVFWSCTKGLVADRVKTEPGLLKPELVLESIQRSPENAFFVLLDFHAYLDEAPVIRKLRDTLAVVSATSKSLFILSSKLVIPEECSKDIVVVELPPPDVEEIQQIFDRSLRAVKGRVTVSLNDEQREQLVMAFRGLSSNEIENVLSRMLVADGRLDAADLTGILIEKGKLIGASGLLQFFPPKENMQVVGGLNLLKEWLGRKRVSFTRHAQDYGLDTPKGLLLVGVPGCGKSLTAKAVSSLWQMPLLRLDIGQLFSSYIGSTEANMRKAIMTAESIAPCVLWIDEIEKGMAGMQSDQADGGVSRRIFATLLTWMQDKQHPVFLIATANDVSSLPPEFLRKGRFDDIFFIDLPNVDERTEILSIHLSKRKRDPTRFDIANLAARTEGFSGADLEGVISEALECAYAEGSDVEQKHLESVASSAVPLAATMAEKIAQVRQWAEGRARRATGIVNGN